MPQFLMINSSARLERSITRELIAALEQKLLAGAQGDVDFNHRDLALQPPAFISQSWIESAFAQDQDALQHRQQLSESTKLIGEIKQADVIVLAAPMYNYGMPASLKAWFDQVIRINETFSFDLQRGDFPLEPILSGKTLVCLTSKGEFGFKGHGIRTDMNFLDGHLQVLASYLGASEVHFVDVEYQEFADQRHKDSKAQAFADLDHLVNVLLEKNTTVLSSEA